MDLTFLKDMGRLFLQAFQHFPGFDGFFADSSIQNTWFIVLGILTFALYMSGAIIIMAGIAIYCLKKFKDEDEGKSSNIKPWKYLIECFVSGMILILLPAIIMIIGAILGPIKTISNINIVTHSMEHYLYCNKY